MNIFALKLLLLCKVLSICFGQIPEEISTELVSPCDNYYRYACSQEQYTMLRKSLMEDFNTKLDEEISLLPDCDAAFKNVMFLKARLEREDFFKELLKRCDDTNFLQTFRIMAYEEIDELPPEGDLSCEEIASSIVDVVMRDDRESIVDLVGVVRKVRDFVALDNLREKNVLVSKAFRKSRKLFKAIKKRYLRFINVFLLISLYLYHAPTNNVDLSAHDRERNSCEKRKTSSLSVSTRKLSSKLEKSITNRHPNVWYEKAKSLKVEFPMRIKRFFTIATLELFNNEYNYCLDRILDVDSRERAFCFSRAWRIARGWTPLSRNMRAFIHNLRDLNVNEREGHVYVRPAYVTLLSNAFMSRDYADEPVIMGSLGFEIIREMTRASYDIPSKTRRCFQRQIDFGDMADPMDEQEENDYIYNVIALQAVQVALPDNNDEKDLKLLLSVSPLIDCANKQTSMMVNDIFARNMNFQKVFDCDETAAMVMTQVNGDLLWAYFPRRLHDDHQKLKERVCRNGCRTAYSS